MQKQIGCFNYRSWLT